MPRFSFSSWLALLFATAFTPTCLHGQNTDERFRAGLASKVQTLEKNDAGAVAGLDGWYFVTAELRMLSVGPFWGSAAVKASRAPKPEQADPVPAILDFDKQLKDRGIHLLMVPVPPKAEIYPEKVAADLIAPASGDPDPSLAAFYDELRKSGVDVLDLAPAFRANKADVHGPVFCKTDTHWSGLGCVLAAQAIADKVRPQLGAAKAGVQPVSVSSEWKQISIDGDLGTMLGASTRKPAAETVAVRQLKEAVAPDSESPVLLLGDSHTLVFHDFLAERAGLLDQLAVELGTVPDRIAIRGSGATAVRIDLYRRGNREAGYLAKKKVVVWCFTAREFTEAAQGWQKVPVAK